MARLIGELPSRFWETIDSESVRPYQAVVYFAAFMSALYLVCIGRLPTVVADNLGPHFNNMWLTLALTGPVLGATGSLLKIVAKRSGNPENPAMLRAVWLTLASNLAMVSVFAVWMFGIIEATYRGKAAFSLGISAALTLCAFILCLRDYRLIRQIDRDADERRALREVFGDAAVLRYESGQ